MLVLTLNEFGIPSKVKNKLIQKNWYLGLIIGFRKHAFKTKIADL